MERYEAVESVTAWTAPLEVPLVSDMAGVCVPEGSEGAVVEDAWDVFPKSEVAMGDILMARSVGGDIFCF